MQLIKKAWGSELILYNELYCAKILTFDPNSKFSMHFHSKKHETWFVAEGRFTLKWIMTEKAEPMEATLNVGDSWIIPPNTPHQLITETGGKIFEASTKHFDSDSYRIDKGDSQL